MSQGLVIGLLLGSLLGVLVVTVVWIIVGGIKMKKSSGDESVEQQAVNRINQECEGIGAFILSADPATINLVQFRAALNEKIAAVKVTIEAQREVLEYYYLKYVERSIGDFEQVVTRIDELLKSMGKGSIATVKAPDAAPFSLPRQQEQAFTATLDSAPTLMDIPLSAMMDQGAPESPAMPELSSASTAKEMPSVAAVPSVPPPAPTEPLPPPPAPVVQSAPVAPSKKEPVAAVSVRKESVPVTPKPIMPDPSVHDTLSMAKPVVQPGPAPVYTPTLQPRQSTGETVYIEMSTPPPMPKDEQGVKLAEAFILSGTPEISSEPGKLSGAGKSKKVDEAFALPQAAAAASVKGKPETGKKDPHDSSLITGEDLEQTLDSFFKL